MTLLGIRVGAVATWVARAPPSLGGTFRRCAGEELLQGATGIYKRTAFWVRSVRTLLSRCGRREGNRELGCARGRLGGASGNGEREGRHLNGEVPYPSPIRIRFGGDTSSKRIRELQEKEVLSPYELEY